MNIQIECIVDEPNIESLYPYWIDIKKKTSIFSITKMPITLEEMIEPKLGHSEVLFLYNYF